LKILNVNAVVDPVTGGGTAERTVQISRSLMKEGIDCCIMTTDIGLSEEELQNFEGMHLIKYRCILKRFYIPLVSYSEIKKVVKGVDIVHLMGHWSVLNALVYMAAQALRKPYVVCPAGALPIFGRSKIIKKIYNWLIGNSIIRNANAWVAITEEEKNKFQPYGVNRDKVTVIPNGVDPADFIRGDTKSFRTKHGIYDHPFMLFLGRLNIIKGPDLLLEAFCKGQDDWQEWHLVYAGPDGGLLESLKKRVDDTALSDRVHFIDYIGGDDKSAAYHAADLLVIPSRQEAMSIVVLESGISATPVVLTDQCGFEQVEDVGGGKVCPATADGIYTSLQEMIGGNKNLVVLGRKLESYVCENYTWHIVIRGYINLYSQLLTSLKNT